MRHTEQADGGAANAGHDINHVQDTARIALELNVTHADWDDDGTPSDTQEHLDVKLLLFWGVIFESVREKE